jgi:hypothetical protein
MSDQGFKVPVRGSRWVITAIAVLLLIVVAPSDAQACAICYGEPDSPAAQGLTWAILALGGLVLVVLGGVVAFFVQASRNPMPELPEAMGVRSVEL